MTIDVPSLILGGGAGLLVYRPVVKCQSECERVSSRQRGKAKDADVRTALEEMLGTVSVDDEVKV